METIKAAPLARVKFEYERDISQYPDTIRVPMSDGNVVTYRIDIQQPHPSFKAVIDLFDKLPVYGGYKCKHGKTT